MLRRAVTSHFGCCHGRPCRPQITAGLSLWAAEPSDDSCHIKPVFGGAASMFVSIRRHFQTVTHISKFSKRAAPRRERRMNPVERQEEMELLAEATQMTVLVIQLNAALISGATVFKRLSSGVPQPSLLRFTLFIFCFPSLSVNYPNLFVGSASLF